MLVVKKSGKVFKYGQEIGYKDNGGYFRVEHTFKTGRATIQVHRLVYLVHGGVIPQGYEINHKDGVKSNNAFSNLELTTFKGNIAHALDTGLINNVGENNPNAVFSDKQVARLRRSYAKGRTFLSICSAYPQFSVVTIRYMLEGRSYKHISGAISVRKEELLTPKRVEMLRTAKQIHKMHKKGLSDYKIAEALGIPRYTVQRYRVKFKESGGKSVW